MKKILRASPYYLEDVRGLRLDQRRKRGKISFLLLNQPPLCDSRCRRCFMPRDRRKEEHPKRTLSLKRSKWILKDAWENGALCLEISGEGEPLLSKNLRGIIEYANNLGVLTTLITNGHSLTEEFIEFLLHSNATLVFSFHTLDQEKYELDNQVPGSFEQKMRNILLARKVFFNSKTIENGFEVYRIAIHATAQADNLDELLRIKQFCEENRIFFSIAPLAQTGCALDHPEIRLKGADEEAILSLAHNSIILSHSSVRELGREVCGTCFYGLNIGYEGSLLLDVHGGYELEGLLGNVRIDTIKKLLEVRESLIDRMFGSIDGFCPVRYPRWNIFLSKIQGKP